MNITWSDIKAKALSVDRTTRFGGNGPIGDEIIYMDDGRIKIVKGDSGMAYIINGSQGLFTDRFQRTLDEIYDWLAG